MSCLLLDLGSWMGKFGTFLMSPDVVRVGCSLLYGCRGGLGRRRAKVSNDAMSLQALQPPVLLQIVHKFRILSGWMLSGRLLVHDHGPIHPKANPPI